MKIVKTLALTVLLLFTPLLVAQQEKYEQTVEGVDLFRIDKFNDQNHNFGTDYLVYNHNPFPVIVSIELTSKQNIVDGLVIGRVRVNPKEKAYLGWLVQANAELNSDWKIQWFVESVLPSTTPQTPQIPQMP